MAPERLFLLASIPPAVRAALGEEQVQRLASAHPRVEVAMIDDPEEFAATLPRADAALVWPALAPSLAPALCPGGRLRWIQGVSAGVESLLTPEVVAAEHVALTATKGPMGPTMAEHALLLMLALARDLPGFLGDQAARRWRFLADERPMVDVVGKTALILGVGAVGGHLARMCKAGLGMRVLGLARTRRHNPHVDRYIERADLPAALGEADFVALCLALTPATARIIDAAALAAMRPTAYLVNVTRGGLVDEEALVAALHDGRLAGAGLDATAAEPLPAESPLWAMPNVIITPHIAPGRDRVGREVVDFWCENIRRFAEGEPMRGAVDRHARY
jgi:phosphoglycerate dehydrogenase-like enzyme